MAPFQHVAVTVGHTADLGFSFRTDPSSTGEDRHVVDYCINGKSDGLREDDLIVGINYAPLPNANVRPSHIKRGTLSHAGLVEQIVTTPRPFIINVARQQLVVAADQPALQRQHQRWFVAFCKHYRIEVAAVKAALRLRRCTKFDNLTTRCHLILCLRIMIKFVDDWIGVTKLSELAGVRLTDSEWFKLEFAVCQQVHWNLVFFCHSSSKKDAKESSIMPANQRGAEREFWEELNYEASRVISMTFNEGSEANESSGECHESDENVNDENFETAPCSTPAASPTGRHSKSLYVSKNLIEGATEQLAQHKKPGPLSKMNSKKCSKKAGTQTSGKKVWGIAGLFGCMTTSFSHTGLKPGMKPPAVPKSALP
jgi:hypothetical protein